MTKGNLRFVHGFGLFCLALILLIAFTPAGIAVGGELRTISKTKLPLPTIEAEEEEPPVEEPRRVSLRVTNEYYDNYEGLAQVIRWEGSERPRLAEAISIDDDGGVRRRLSPSTEGGGEVGDESLSLAGECTTGATVEIIATEITWGPNGSDVWLELDYELGAGAPTALFGGTNLQNREGETDTLPPGQPGDILTFYGRSEYNSGSTYLEFPNSDPNNAMILLNGMNFYETAAHKGVQAAFGGQLEIDVILADFLDGDGYVVNLLPNEMFILYELGTTDQTSDAFDFQDLVIRVYTDCDVVGDVLVRDTIGVDGEYVDGMGGARTFRTGSNFHGAPGVVISLPSQGSLAIITVPLYGHGFSGSGQEGDPYEPDWQGSLYDVYIWPNGAGEFITEMQQGSLPPCTAPDCFSSSLPEIGVSVSEIIGVYLYGGTDYYNQRNVSIDLSQLDIAVEAGQEIVIAVIPVGTASVFFHSVSSWDDDPVHEGDVYSSVLTSAGCGIDGVGCGPGGCCPAYIGPTGLDWGFKWFGARLTIAHQ